MEPLCLTVQKLHAIDAINQAYICYNQDLPFFREDFLTLGFVIDQKKSNFLNIDIFHKLEVLFPIWFVLITFSSMKCLVLQQEAENFYLLPLFLSVKHSPNCVLQTAVFKL